MKGQPFDKVIKENLTASFFSLLRYHLNIDIAKAEILPPAQHSTLKREVDYLAKVKTTRGEIFILHLEFQTHDDPSMIHRMAEYHGILFRKYKLPIKQFVIYLGDKKSSMRTSLKEEEIMKGFDLYSLRERPSTDFLSHTEPEMIILAVLSDFQDQPAEEVILQILEKLSSLNISKTQLEKHISQLEILSNLRKLNLITTNIIKAMPFTIELEESSFYYQAIQKGLKKGMEQGIEKGMEQGIEKEKLATIVSLKKEGVDISIIAKATRLSIEKVEEILENLP